MSLLSRPASSSTTGTRTVDSLPAPADARTCCHLPEGASFVIAQIAAHPDERVRRRLIDLGLRPGALVEVIRRAPLGGPLVLRVADYDIALRRSEASCLLVSES